MHLFSFVLLVPAVLVIYIQECLGLQVKEQDILVYSVNYSRPEYELQDFAAVFPNVSVRVPSCYTLTHLSDPDDIIDKTECYIGITEDDGCDKNVTDLPDELLEFFTSVSETINARKFSCEDMYNTNPSAPSGYYMIYDSNNVKHKVYCNMDEGSNCDGKGGWMRVVYLNMTDPTSTCPSGMTTQTYSNIGHKLCGRSPSAGGDCDSIWFPVDGLNYSKVCGKMRGYQYHSPDGFHGYLNGKGIESNYVCGYSITHGSNPRKHIWTYAGGVYQDHTNIYDCPCNTGYGYDAIPPFVGNDYYCEAGLPIGHSFTGLLYADDILWDGQMCLGLESPCCTSSKMPWFYKALSETTNDDIELRACSLYGTWDEDVPIDMLELYVK